ncbi:MAG: hypothetical protein Q7S92_06135 [Candidatus Diapherotrites archaeon]|nr:hypothetical protein [Candidatus Diapherotrites archaeon]
MTSPKEDIERLKIQYGPLANFILFWAILVIVTALPYSMQETKDAIEILVGIITISATFSFLSFQYSTSLSKHKKGEEHSSKAKILSEAGACFFRATLQFIIYAIAFKIGYLLQGTVSLPVIVSIFIIILILALLATNSFTVGITKLAKNLNVFAWTK